MFFAVSNLRAVVLFQVAKIGACNSAIASASAFFSMSIKSTLLL
jgi:hypothetical protein